MKTYLSEISRVKLLSRDEEHALAVKVRDQVPGARESMVRANLRLVVAIGRSFRGRGFSYADLVAEGNVGLIKAVDRFDPDRGCRFSTYAAWWIRQSMLRAISQKTRTVRIPNDLVDIVWRFRRRVAAMTAATGQSPSFDAVANAMGLARSLWDRVKAALAASKGVVALNPTDDESRSPASLTADPKADSPWAAADQRSQHAHLRRILRRLRTREQAVVKMRFGLEGSEPMTLQQCGDALSISRERVRQIEQGALRRLQEILEGRETPRSTPRRSPRPSTRTLTKKALLPHLAPAAA